MYKSENQRRIQRMDKDLIHIRSPYFLIHDLHEYPTIGL